MSEDNKRKGRPKADNPLEHDCKCRFTHTQLVKLDAYCKRNAIKRAQAIRKAVLDMLEADAASAEK